MLATTTRFTRSGLASLAGVTRRTFTSQRVLFNASNSDSNGQPPADDPLASILKASMDDKPADTESKASQEQTGCECVSFPRFSTCLNPSRFMISLTDPP